MLSVEEHPLLDARAFITRYPASLGEMDEAPGPALAAVRGLLDTGAQAPLASDDHVGFLPHVDCALLISAAESTTMNQLDVCEKELSELTNVLGVVLNKCRFNESDTDYYTDYY